MHAKRRGIAVGFGRRMLAFGHPERTFHPVALQRKAKPPPSDRKLGVDRGKDGHGYGSCIDESCTYRDRHCAH